MNLPRVFFSSNDENSRSACAVMRAMAGSPAGLRATRRGSFLVLVVGTLAIMSVFAVVYIAIGRADLGTSAGVKRNAERDDVPQQLGNYIADKIIAEDVFSTYVDGVDSAGNPMFHREDTDYPATPWDVTSLANTNPTLNFRPVGTALTSDYSLYKAAAATTFISSDRHLPSDPWLASLTPTWLNYSGVAPNAKQYLDYRDWAQISNVAPDGAFVNLANLRGNFGISSTEMRQDLSLLKPLASGLMDPTNDTDFGTQIRFATARVSGKAVRVSQYPAELTMRQRGAFRLATDVTFLPSNPKYAMNQWADADGDGFLDSRWFEMVDARNPSLPKGLLKTNGKIRYFFATRIVDLSGLVNVTTATDTVTKPTLTGPIGLTPSDVDLRRLLTMQDFQDQFGGVAYGTIPNRLPLNANDPDNYSLYDANAVRVASAAYGALFATGDIASTTRPPTGRGAMVSGIIPPTPPLGGLPKNEFYFGSSNFWAYGDPMSKVPLAGSVLDRSQVYRRLAANMMNVSAAPISQASGPALDGLLVSTVNTSDLEDLLTYRGLNNPEITSNLELILGGRLASNASVARYDPLRGNRGFDVEREKQDIAAPFGQADPDAMLLAATSVRQYLTTTSGARPIRSTRLPIKEEKTDSDKAANAVVVNNLSKGELKIKITPDAASLFKGYAAALIPDAHPAVGGLTDDTWSATKLVDAAYDPYKHLNYGARTPELGAIMSAHMAANMAAALSSQNANDADGLLASNAMKPYTLLLAESERAFVDKSKTPYAWTYPEKLMDLGKDKLADVKSKVLNPVMNVYGIVPEPVITAFAVYHVYKGVGGTNKPYIVGSDENSKDYGGLVGQVLAIQITNPFNEIIKGYDPKLKGKPNYDRRYVEYGGRRLYVDFDKRSPTVALDYAPGETKTFFAVWSDAYSDKFDSWAGGQMPNPIRVEESDANGVVTDSTGAFVDVVSDVKANLGNTAPTIHKPTVEVVRLWRAPLDRTLGWKVDPFGRKDQLVDRFRIPLDPTKKLPEDRWLRLPPGQQDIAPENDTKIYGDLAITLGVVFRRPKDPLGATADTIAAGAPAFMIERKYTSEFAKNFGFINEAAFVRESVKDSPLAFTDFESSPYGDQSIDAMFMSQGGQSVFQAPFDKWLVKSPKDWPDPTINQTASNQINGAKFADLRTEILRWSSVPATTKLLDVARVGDMLTPLAVGPEFSPLNPTAAQFEDSDYTTLGEALAMALGYDRAAAGATDPRPFQLIGNQFGGHQKLDASGGAAAGSNTFALVDRGHLRLDEFAPFYDAAPIGAFDKTKDYRRGSGIPLALNVLNVFTTVEPQLDRLVPGTVNANTAPLPVLRTLPLFTPPNPASLPLSSTWWFASHGTGSDVAAAAEAYRDKSIVNTRVAGTLAKFDDAGTKPTDIANRYGRRTANPIDALRESPGFASIGELMAIHGGNTADPADPSNIDYLGHSTSVTIPTDGVRSGDPVAPTAAPTLKDLYSDKLLIANAASSTVAVRSDVFAVWFVVAGFAKTDLVRGDGTPLLDTDPLVPSVQRRFLMVVDRSNVVEKGQKPRIVLFKEVPM